jgi:ribosome-associated toxin RatA of RatAB toxin-antitoxin module
MGAASTNALATPDEHAAPVRRDEDDVPTVQPMAVAGSKLSGARATVLVRAALERVRAVLLDFHSYPAFMPHYKSAHVEAKNPDGSLRIHMEIDALGGMIQRWMRIEMSAPAVDGARETYEGKLLEGDVRGFKAKWVLEQVAEGTRLTVESFLDGKIELPSAFLDAGGLSGLKDSILAIKTRAEDPSRP